MMRSLRARLFVGLGLFVLLTGLAAGIVTFLWAFEESIELQDAVLLQLGALAAGNRLRTDQLAQRGVDAEARFVIDELASPRETGQRKDALLPLHADIADGLHTLGRDRLRWRVLVRTRADGSRVAVGQLTTSRDEIARGSALRTVLPFAVLIPCLLLLTRIVIDYSFRSISRLAARLDAGEADRLDALSLEGVPEELRPFIESINRLLRRIATVLEQQRRFVADAAHELRSPITALSVQADNLDHAGLRADGLERLAALKTGIRRTAHLLEQLLALAKYESHGALQAQTAAFDQVARGVVAELLPSAQARGVDLGFERIESLAVCADATALTVLVRNLLDNALRHTPDRGRVNVHLYAEGAHAVLRVEDTGLGICEADLAHIFEPFFRGRRSEGDGTGLGLSIVHRIVESLDGSIALENIRPPTQGQGLRVVVAIPAVRTPSR